jgi:hypothetical protein
MRIVKVNSICEQVFSWPLGFAILLQIRPTHKPGYLKSKPYGCPKSKAVKINCNALHKKRSMKTK